MIIAVNKWDLVEKDDKTIYKFTNKIREVLAYMSYAELIFISAKTGQRFPKIFDMLDAVIENHAMRVQTGVLNEILAEAVAMKQPPSDKGKRLKLYYMTQVSVKPPTFVVFINDRQLMHFGPLCFSLPGHGISAGLHSDRIYHWENQSYRHQGLRKR